MPSEILSPLPQGAAAPEEKLKPSVIERSLLELANAERKKVDVPRGPRAGSPGLPPSSESSCVTVPASIADKHSTRTIDLKLPVVDLGARFGRALCTGNARLPHRHQQTMFA